MVGSRVDPSPSTWKGQLNKVVSLFTTTTSGSTASRGAYELLDNPDTAQEELRRRAPSPRISNSYDQSLTKHSSDLDRSTSHGLSITDGPTTEERASLRRIADEIPWSAFLIAVVEICERFTYHGLAGVLQNYVQRSPDDPSGLPGALGLDQAAATRIVSFLQFFAYLFPVPGAIVADQYLGRYKTIFYSSIIYAVGVFLLVLTALPPSIANGTAFGGLLVSLFIICIGTGGIKSNVGPLIAEQYDQVRLTVRTLETGERVIVDPAVTVQRIYMIFYACINIGALSPVLTVYLERDVGFWSSFLMCGLVFVVGTTILVRYRKHYISQPPKGSVVPNALRICWIALKHGNLNAAKPSVARRIAAGQVVPWDDQFVDEVGRALIACRVLSYLPIYWLCFNQMLSNFISQAGQMELHGIPNDLMQNIDPLAIIIFIPLLDRLVYPALRRLSIPFKPITRIFAGFLLGSGAMAYAAMVQWRIYQAGPCYASPLACEAAVQADGSVQPNRVHVALQAPAYILVALSEVCTSVTGLEYSFTKAPASLKSFVMSLFLLTSAIAAVLGALVSPLATDPTLLWLYLGLSIAALIAGLMFWRAFRKYNDEEESMNELEQHGDRAGHVGEHIPND